ncbi:Cyclase family protein [Sphingobium herbicidovorans NBRC 16415]|uniref:Cyclase family protein n=1 Tax=Sphingobium herbicidovorans (strain ATCC 700291 / DSM 11019 / CCUG 56400 / KCTC 2939 / LMG 18315 / NBRC 16415 / MH) TaxID=1219045 RepID=A0A086P637_SPHHM|nr:cyclase family protein [Sphingobium herbicidovorans]KFG88855.1 Cyclase family protein [Sphingobium herbicidovorans NBRC 16415]
MPRWVNRPEGSNWGEFGEDDQIGRMNLLTPERRLAAMTEVREGVAFTLSLPLNVPTIPFAPFRHPPRLSAACDEEGGMFNRRDPGGDETTCDDRVLLYTQHSTQWDSLAHRGRAFDADGDGIAELVYYNGFRAGDDVSGADGPSGESCARALGIETLATAGVQGRGVMINLKAAYGIESRAVTRDDLLRAMDAQRVEVRTGDFLLLYTGVDRLILDREARGDGTPLATAGCALDGRDEGLLQWIIDSGIVAICSDNIAIEALDLILSPEPPPIRLPIHDLCLFRQGIFLGELWYLERLAVWLHKRERHAFLLTAPPLRLPGSVGSPVTPVATV